MKAAQRRLSAVFICLVASCFHEKEKEKLCQKTSIQNDMGRPSLQIEVGQLAKQANGAVLVRYGDTVVLSAAVASKEAKIQTFPINDQL